MTKRKNRKGIVCGLCFVFMLTALSGCTSTPAEENPASAGDSGNGYNYSAEVQTMEVIARHWDETEIREKFEDFSAKLAKGEGWDGFIAENISDADRETISGYFGEFEGGDVKYVYTKFPTFYKVECDDDYNDLRGILEYKFQVTKDQKVTEYTVLLNMARLGDAGGVDWKIYDILWKDNGIDVSDVDLFQLDPPAKGEEVCVMTTDAGVIKLRLFPEQAPLAVENWIQLSKEGFYNDTIFARVIKDFVIQGGALDGSGDESICIYDEFYEDEVEKGLYNFDGSLCLGNNGPHTNGNQFYIVQNTEANEEQLPRLSLPGNVEEKYKEIGGLPELDGRYTVFGQVYEGLDVVVAIASQETDDDDAPLADPVKILSIEFEVVE